MDLTDNLKFLENDFNPFFEADFVKEKQEKKVIDLSSFFKPKK